MVSNRCRSLPGGGPLEVEHDKDDQLVITITMVVASYSQGEVVDQCNDGGDVWHDNDDNVDGD